MSAVGDSCVLRVHRKICESFFTTGHTTSPLVRIVTDIIAVTILSAVHLFREQVKKSIDGENFVLSLKNAMESRP